MMPIKRDQITNNYSEQSEPTKNLSFKETSELNERIEIRTGDKAGVSREYENDTEAHGTELSFGAILPKDMTVQLIRADSVMWETLIAFLNSISLSFFMLFLGEFTAKEHLFTRLEIMSLWVLGGFTLILSIIWFALKIKQQKGGVTIPIEALRAYTTKTEEN